MPEYKLNCEVCKKEFISKRSHTKSCSRKCQKKASYDRLKNKRTRTCKQCGKEFNAATEKAELCSVSCINKFCANDSVKLNCGWCGVEFQVEYKHRDRKYCSQSCSANFNNKAGMIGFNCFDSSGENNPMYGKKAWNNGLSKDSDERLKNLGRNVSRVLKEKFANGEMSNAGENNPMYGRRGENSPIFGIKRSKKTKELMSKVKAEQWLSGVYDYIDFNSSYKMGYYFSTKINKKIWFRSSWEKTVLAWLDKNHYVVKFENEPIKISYYYQPDKQNRNYIPDLIVEFQNGEKKMIEIKPKRYHNTIKNQAKFNAAIEYCKQNGLIFEVWDENKIQSLII